MGAYVYDLGMEWIFAIVATSSLIQFLVILFFVYDRRIYTRKTRTKVSMISYDRYLILFSVTGEYYSNQKYGNSKVPVEENRHERPGSSKPN